MTFNNISLSVILFLHFLKAYIYLHNYSDARGKGRDKMKERSCIYWFTLQIPSIATSEAKNPSSSQLSHSFPLICSWSCVIPTGTLPWGVGYTSDDLSCCITTPDCILLVFFNVCFSLSDLTVHSSSLSNPTLKSCIFSSNHFHAVCTLYQLPSRICLLDSYWQLPFL